MIDPTYLYIVPYITVRFNPKQTTKTPGELAASISSRVISFEQNYMSSFGKSFRFSRFLDYLDSTDEAILTTEATIRLRKTFTPNLSGVNSYSLNFNNSLQRLGEKEVIAGNSKHPGYGGVTSSTFLYAGNNSYFDDNGFGTMRIYYPSTAGQLGRVYTNYTAGTVNYATGVVNIDNFLPTSYTGDVISVIAAPGSPNITPVRNQILLMSQCDVNVVDDNTGLTLATASNIETVGQTTTLLTPSIKLYNF
jgi:hypothetical protein